MYLFLVRECLAIVISSDAQPQLHDSSRGHARTVGHMDRGWALEAITITKRALTTKRDMLIGPLSTTRTAGQSMGLHSIEGRPTQKKQNIT